MNRELPTRRGFLRTTLVGGALTWTVPAFLARTWDALGAEAVDRATQAVTGRDGPILVVIQLAGGNDGLNTLVPFADDHYRRARGSLAVPAEDVLRLNDRVGFHPSLGGLRALHDSGHLAVVQGVGYPNPNRSHFRSMEIWQTASDADRFERHGWLGRYFDNACVGAAPTVGLSVGRQMPQAFAAVRPTGVTFEGAGRGAGGRPRRPAFEADGAMGMEASSGSETGGSEGAGMSADASGATVGAPSGSASVGGSVLDFLDRTAADATASGARIREVLGRAKTTAAYPESRLGQSLKLVGQLIGGGLATRVYYVSLGGFDTHTNQAGTHGRLLQEYGDGLKAFLDDLRAQGNLGRVLAMTFSEFGRRVAGNASGGTDHGAGGLMFLAGERFRSPLLGTHPSLAPGDLANGDLRFNVDFRRVYAAVLERWLKTPSEPVLGRKYEPLGIF